MPHPALAEEYIAPAEARSEWWRIPITLIITAVLYFVLLFSIVFLASSVFGAAGIFVDIEACTTPLGRDCSPISLLVLLSTFFGMFAGIIIAMLLLHRRGLLSLLGRPLRRVASDFVLFAAIIAVLYGVGSFLFPEPTDPIPNISTGDWLYYLPFALPLLLIQISAEELIFRGYLLQQMAVISRSRLLWAVLPSILFGMLHYQPETFGANLWPVLAVITLGGILAAEVTMRRGNLGGALGLHFANNFAAMLIVSSNDGLNGLALYRSAYSADDTDVVGPALYTQILIMLAILAALYFWDWWRARR